MIKEVDYQVLKQAMAKKKKKKWSRKEQENVSFGGKEGVWDYCFK